MKTRHKKKSQGTAKEAKSPLNGRRLAWIIALGVSVVIGVAVWLDRDRDASEVSQSRGFDPVRLSRLFDQLSNTAEGIDEAGRHHEVAKRIRNSFDLVSQQSALQRFVITENEREIEHFNIIARINPEAKRRVILATSWSGPPETEPAEKSPRYRFDGVTTLLEVSRILVQPRHSTKGVDIVLFDGERLGSEPLHRGSEYFTKRISAFYPQSRPEFAIVIESVGGCDATFNPELESVKRAPNLVLRTWDTARDSGKGRFFPSGSPRVVQGAQLAFHRMGIQSLLLIDPEHPGWHTQADAEHRLCGETLAAVGEVLVELVAASHEEDPNG